MLTLFHSVGNFPKVIKHALEKAKAVVVVIGPEWVNARNDQGNQRLNDPEDFVRLEIETAHELQIPIIPVLLGNACLPTVEELPLSLNFLPFLQSLSIRPDPDFQIGIGRLCSALEKLTKWPWLWVKKKFWAVIVGILAIGVLVWFLSIDNESLTVKDLNPTKVASEKITSTLRQGEYAALNEWVAAISTWSRKEDAEEQAKLFKEQYLKFETVKRKANNEFYPLWRDDIWAVRHPRVKDRWVVIIDMWYGTSSSLAINDELTRLMRL